ncbi:hypothetical protein O181_043949 [Austropuccinia psidii MF-1]|uniref:Uncharacterized protein n=1 Tax=Austropuccinia psidii MF-1 TaxID=1389203 RepID=A0A9Q3HIY2_9BASI|nr:hypothetical protein [Austropuccinia psidii MF-1]
MANLTPDSQLSAYERINCQLSGNQDQVDDVHSGQISPNLMNDNMEQTNSGQITGQMNWEASPSETSTQRRKRHMSEEA